jgi:ribosomal protein L19
VGKEGVASITTPPDFFQHHDDKKYNIFAGILIAIENGGKSDITIMAQLASCVQVQQRIASEVSAVIDIVVDSFSQRKEDL